SGEFGGLGWPATWDDKPLEMRVKGDTPQNSTIAVVASDAALTRAQAKRVAVMAHGGLARALRPAHAALDGDIVFAAATARSAATPTVRDLTEIGLIAADTLARAIARAVYEATALPFAGTPPAWRDNWASLRASAEAER